MIIGLDFDNTIVDYDRVFYHVARERNLVPPETPPLKNAVRDCMRKAGIEDEWTALQGYVYGCRMLDAECYPGVMDCLSAIRENGITIYIISHKTRTPYLGPAYDLHQSARDFLKAKGFFDASIVGMPPENVFFELTKAEKIKRIGLQQCDIFLDDLPEILTDPTFPDRTTRILFDPTGKTVVPDGITRVTSWDAFRNVTMSRGSGHG